MKSWTFSGIKAEIDDKELRLTATSTSSKMLLGASGRLIELQNIFGLEHKKPTALKNGNITVADGVGKSTLAYPKKQQQDADELFEKLANSCPQAVGTKITVPLWNSLLENQVMGTIQKLRIDPNNVSSQDDLKAKISEAKASNAADAAEAKVIAAQLKSQAKESAAAKKATEKAAKQLQSESEKADFINRYGTLLADEVFGSKRVWIYSKGYVSVGLFSPGTPTKLLGISGNADVTKKTVIGRGVVAAMTMGANLALTPNKRGDAYLSITTDIKTYMLHMSPPTEQGLKAMRKLEGAGQAVLDMNVPNQVIVTNAGTEPDLALQLEKLSALKQSGALSEAEYQAAKKQLLGL